jgi:HEAT repeat protein
MGLSKEVRELLQQGREDALAELAGADSRALRPLVGRLWDPDDEIRRRAARVIGRAAAADVDSGMEIIRRLMWALNDESATNGVHAVPPLGEIGRRAPELLAPYIPALVSMSWDGGIRLALLEALTAVAETDPRLTAGHLAQLETAIDRSRPEERHAFRRLVVATRKGGDHAD